jgi:alpha-glucuronidase
MKSYKNMTRLDFLKCSGLMTAGFTFLPQAAWATVKNSQESYQVSIEKLAGYQIVVPDQTNPIEQLAAEKLQHYVAELSRKNLTLKKEAEYRSGPAFFIGQTHYANTRKVDFKQLKEDGFAYHPAGRNLIIAGGTGKGTLYGIYGLLELWGFRMYASTATDVPNVASISIPKDEVIIVPAVQYRTTSYRDTHDPEYTN